MKPVDWIVCWLSELSMVFAFNKENWQSAVRHSSRALLIKPNDADLLGMRGVALLSMGKTKLAIADLSQALQIRPAADTYINRAIAYRDEGEFDLSIADCDEALKLRPQDISIYVEKAQTYRERGDFATAIANFKTALTHYPDPDLYIQLAETQAEADEWVAAFKTWQQALDLSPDDLHIYFSRGKAYAHRGEMENAKADFDYLIQTKMINQGHQLTNRNAKERELTAYLAVVYYDTGRQDKALELWRALLNVEPRYNDLEWIETEYYWSEHMLALSEKITTLVNSGAVSTS